MATEQNWKWDEQYGNHYSQKWEDNEWKTTWKDLGPYFAVGGLSFYTPGTIYANMSAGLSVSLDLVLKQHHNGITVCELWYVDDQGGITNKFAGDVSSKSFLHEQVSGDLRLVEKGSPMIVGSQIADGPRLRAWADQQRRLFFPKKMSRYIAWAEKIGEKVETPREKFETLKIKSRHVEYSTSV